MRWTNHIDSIINSVSKISDVLMKFKYKLDRSILQKIYFNYARPKLKYAHIIWDKCSDYNKQKLDDIQLLFARIVTVRRYVSKLKFMYRLKSKLVPEYLSELLPKTRYVTVNYGIRSSRSLNLFRCRTQRFLGSSLSDGVRKWNHISPELKIRDTLHEFKSKVCSLSKIDPMYLALRGS